MPILDEMKKIINPLDPSLTGLIPTGATVAGGLVGLNAAGDASQHQAAGVDEAIGAVNAAGAKIPGVVDNTLKAQQDLYNPYVNAGKGALDQLSSGVLDGSLTAPFHYDRTNFENDPAYQFLLSEGEKGRNRIAASRGSWASPATFKDLQQFQTGLADTTFGADYSRSENTFRANQQARLKELKDLTGVGLTASNALASDTGHAGDANIQGIEWTATNIADLVQAKADAIAAGDIGKANQINELISGLTSEISQNGALAKILKTAFPSAAGITTQQALDQISNAPFNQNAQVPGLTAPDLSTVGESQGLLAQLNAMQGTDGLLAANEPPVGNVDVTSQIEGQPAETFGSSGLPSAVAPAVAAAAPATAAGIGALSSGLPEGIVTATSQIAGAAPEVLGATVTAADAAAGLTPELAAAGWTTDGLASTSVTGGGMSNAIIGLMTNPITIGVAAAIIGVTALLKSQAHWESNSWTKGFQGPFDSQMNDLNSQFNQAAASGALSKDQAMQIRNEAGAALQTYLQKLDNFYREKGLKSDQSRVAAQAYQTFLKYYGEGGQGFLGNMDATISQLPE